MSAFPPTTILRHTRENLKKCSLRGLEGRPDLAFFTYPLKRPLPPLEGYVLLSLEGSLLTTEDRKRGLLFLDGTWRYAAAMERNTPGLETLPRRRLPAGCTTAYPRIQTGCADPTAGLATVEALYIAHVLLERDVEGLLDHYHWRLPFLEKNRHALQRMACGPDRPV